MRKQINLTKYQLKAQNESGLFMNMKMSQETCELLESHFKKSSFKIKSSASMSMCM